MFKSFTMNELVLHLLAKDKYGVVSVYIILCIEHLWSKHMILCSKSSRKLEMGSRYELDWSAQIWVGS